MHVVAVGTFDVRHAATVDACVALEPTTKDKPRKASPRLASKKRADEENL